MFHREFQIAFTGGDVNAGGVQAGVSKQRRHFLQSDLVIHQVLGIEWKGGALHSCEYTFPPSPLQTGQATYRCIRLSNIAFIISRFSMERCMAISAE
jgi:hypothetical protein